MENNTDILKEMVVSFLRKALFSIGAYLVTRGWLTQDTANTLIGNSILVPLAGAILVLGTVIWQWAKIRFNNLALKQAVTAEPGTPVGVVKTETLQKESLVTSL